MVDYLTCTQGLAEEYTLYSDVLRTANSRTHKYKV